MTKLRVLVVDDSVVYRTQIKAALEDFPQLEVVGTASNGKFALQRLAQFEADLITLDLEMPEMDGIATLKELARLNVKSKVVVFSSASKRGAEITMEALALGASDFVAKPDGAGNQGNPKDTIKALLVPKMQALFPDAFELPSPVVALPAEAGNFSKVIWELMRPKIIVIGSSTGGPTVLETIFAQLAGPLKCPIVIAQHMPPIFTATLVERLGKLSGIKAKEAVDGEALEDNCIYMAPGNYHLRLRSENGRTVLRLDQGEQINFVRPAVDPLFETAAELYRDKCLGFILTGMGQDGMIGAQAVKNQGGSVVIQDEKSCIVFGMPGAVFRSGAYDHIADPGKLAQMLQEKSTDGVSLRQTEQRKAT